jgi:hypothetical protein
MWFFGGQSEPILIADHIKNSDSMLQKLTDHIVKLLIQVI